MYSGPLLRGFTVQMLHGLRCFDMVFRLYDGANARQRAARHFRSHDRIVLMHFRLMMGSSERNPIVGRGAAVLLFSLSRKECLNLNFQNLHKGMPVELVILYSICIQSLAVAMKHTAR